MGGAPGEASECRRPDDDLEGTFQVRTVSLRGMRAAIKLTLLRVGTWLSSRKVEEEEEVVV